MVKQDKTIVKPPYDPKKYIVLGKDKGRFTKVRERRMKVRN